MGEKEIEIEYEHFKHDVERMAEEELKKIRKRVEMLEIEAERVGKETENILNNNKKVKKEST